MISVSLGDNNFENLVKKLNETDFAEIRLDMSQLPLDKIKELFSGRKRLIAVFRPGGAGEEERLGSLITAIESGAAFVDIEVDADNAYRESLISVARKNKCKVIISYHNESKTPSLSEMDTIINNAFAFGADIVKLACRAGNPSDTARLLSMYERRRDDRGKLIIIGMGTTGMITRVAATFLGAPFTYASYARGEETAQGQIDHATLKNFIDTLKND
jgi:3-dehydroquinate dehydratase type I